MRTNQEDTNAFNTLLKSGRFSHARKVLNGPDTITLNGPLINFLDANGSTRVVTLPALDRGRFFVVSNVGTTGNLTVQSDVGVTITTLLPSDTALMFAGDLQWAALRGWAALGVFTNTVNGLVPAPVSGVPGSLFLRDDGQWGQVQVTGIVDAFKFITDGTTIATGSGPDTFRLRSSTGKIGVTVQNNDVTFGDNANFTVNEASVNHNALLNYVADQHVAHSGVVLNPGTGMSGGGDITVSRTLNFNPHSLTVNAAPALTDYAVMDLAAGGPRTALFSVLNALFIHNNLAGYVANEHINHTGVSIVAGAGISGGGDITTSRTVALDINGLASATPAATDTFPFYNAAATAPKKLTLTALNGLIDHNALLNYVANQHIDHTAVTITAGTGLTGGGTIAATRTLSLATIANNTVHGNVSGSAAVPIGLTQAQLTALINAATTTLSGAVPAPGTATGKVLSDALTWVAAGAGDMLKANNLSDVTSAATSRTNLAVVGAVKVQKFTASGTYTPSAGMLYCIVEMVGGGGGGGGALGAVGQSYGAGGGGSGGYSRLVASAATIGASKTITIGAAGAGGAAGTNNGGNGGDTSMTTLCIAKGGLGGKYGNSAASPDGGLGGVAGTGDLVAAGAPGQFGIYNTGTAVANSGGFGGSSFFGGGGPGASANGSTALAGNAASNYGSGGGGASANNVVASAAGGGGSAGYVFITEYCTS